MVKKNPQSVNLCVCVSPLSCRGIAAVQPATTAALLSAFSPAPVSSRHAITQSNETGENASQAASCKHTVPESITSLSPSVHASLFLSLSLSSSFLPLSRLACTICGSWVDECGGMERDWKTVLLSHSNWDKNLAYALPPPPPPPPPPPLSLLLCVSVFLFLKIIVLIFLFQSTSLFFFFLLLSLFLSLAVYLVYFYLCSSSAVYMRTAIACTFSETIVKFNCVSLFIKVPPM